MDATTNMNSEAARCFRHACEASSPLEQAIYNSMRQAWLALAQQVQNRASTGPRLWVASDTVRFEPRPAAKRTTSRRKSPPTRKSSPPARRRKLAA